MKKFIQSHLGSLLFVIVGLLGAIILSVNIYLGSVASSSSIERAVANATSVISQYKIIRGYYAKKVVTKAKKNGLKVDSNHYAADTIPLPATLIHDISQLLGKNSEDIQLKLYSDFPFPNRKSRTLDSFAKKAIAHLKKNKDETYVETDYTPGKEVVRVAIADVMQAQACIDCHNSHPTTPKSNWQVGDVRGVLEVITPISKEVNTNSHIKAVLAWLTVVAFILVGAVVFMFSHFIKSRKARINKMLISIDHAASGDFTHDVDEKGEDDLGKMGTALSRLINNLSESIGTIADNANKLDTSSKSLEDLSKQMGDDTNTVSGQINSATSATGTVSSNVQSVANSTQEMSSSIRKIASQTNSASEIASTGVNVAESTNSIVRELGESSTEISQVSKVITSIAEQTNLLALNATIEAARAGEAGKGFAVVANEVKELAKESANASEEISKRIVAIQRNSNEAVDAISKISDIIHQIDDIQTTIATAIEQQSATTMEIERNVGSAADSSSAIANTMNEVGEAADRTTQASSEVLQASGGLAQMAAQLQTLVSKFKYK